MGQDSEISALRSRRVWSRSGRAAHTGTATVMHSEQSLTIVKRVKGNVSGLSGVPGDAARRRSGLFIVRARVCSFREPQSRARSCWCAPRAL